MKSIPPVEDFFKQLQDELEPSAYSERLQQELHNHVEDAVYEKQLEGTPLEQAEIKTLTQLGDPKLISTTLKRMLQQHSLPRLYAKMLLVGLFTWPAGIIFIHVFGAILESLPSLLYNTHNAVWLAPIIMSFTYVVGLVLLFRLTLYDLYAFLKTEPSWWHRLGLMASVFSLPTFIRVVPFISIGDGSLIEILPFFIYETIGLAIALGVILYFFRWQERRLLKQWQSQGQQIITSTMQQRSHRLGLVITIATLIFIMTTTITPYVLPSPSTLLHQRATIEPLLLRALPLLLHLSLGAEGDIHNLILGYTIEAWLLLGLALVMVWYIGRYLYQRVYFKKIIPLPWLIITVLVYSTTVLFCPPRYAPEPQWRVPHKNLSTLVEHEAIGSWYNFISYAAQYDTLFNYSLKTDQTDLLFQTTTHQTYRLSDIQSVDHFQLTKTYLKKKSVGYDATPPQLGLQCLPSNNYNSCTELQWQGKVIFTNSTVPLSLLAQKITPDQNFALVMLGEINNTHYHLYLIDLR